ncbi:group II intron maturase-specific domain-containing protein [Parasutterella excrementihominis]|uniref:group II intron maturase-specific domain-containing protein n=1 Tax=Parasutterella excrementihominis TaxID=487175 RepID=UPI003AF60225
MKFLGLGFSKREGKYNPRPHKKSLKKLKLKIKAILGRSRGISLERYQTELTTTLRGWYNYFKIGLSKTRIQTLDECTRRRIRMLYWKRWKKIKTKYEALMKLGVNRCKA